MVAVGTNEYDAVFPTTPCGTVVNYYVSVESDQGESFSNPPDAPTSFFTTISASSISTVFADDFETDLGWTVSGDATDGQWERGVPAGDADRGDPEADGDGSGNCFLTDNVAGNSDVDGGSTILTSPSIDASVGTGQVAVLCYDRWYNNSIGTADDIFEIEISNDDGANWVALETVGPTGSEVSGGWVKKQFLINEIVAPTSSMRVRFIATDIGTGSIVEAAVDGIEIQIVDCVIVETSINQGEFQRSMLMDLDVSFAGDVQIDGSAFVLEKLGDGDVPTSFTTAFEDGRTNATLSFSGPFTETSGSLVDGNYQLTIDGGGVTDAQGSAMDIDGDGSPGGTIVIGDEESEALYRLFGDVDQSRSVNIIDLLGFRQAFQMMTGDASFDAGFDWNVDGLINVIDLLRFRQNYLKTLPYDDGSSLRLKSGSASGKLIRR
jgi:hypothetical protein